MIIKNIKDHIIFLTLEYLENKDSDKKQQIRDLLKEFGKNLHIPVKKLPEKAQNQKDIKKKHSEKKKVKMKKHPVYSALKAFISNESGYIFTIQNLYNEL